MAITESRLRDGVLKLGTTPTELDFSCQVTNARINSTYDDDGDALETLCGDVIAAGRKLGGRSLAGTFVQDWTDPTGVTEFCYDHDLEVMAFTFTPNAEGPTLSGELRIEVPAETYGGDVNARLTSDFEWTITTPLTRTPPVVTAAASSSSTPASEPAIA